MGYINSVSINGDIYPLTSSLYGTCSTASDTSEKIVTCLSFDTLKNGVVIFVTFSYGNSSANPTLNINNTGAKSITRGGYPIEWTAGSTIQFMYNENNWCMITNDSAKPEIGGQTISGIASENISAGEFVYTTNGSTWSRAVNGIAKNYSAIGISLTSAVSGATLSIRKVIGSRF